MIQIHLWIPEIVHVEQWEQKINSHLNDLADTFPLLELGPVKTHRRNFIFNATQLKTQIDEAIFIPVCKQLHIIVLTDYDVYPEDPHRVVDELVHIDSIARLTRRIQVLVFDTINSESSTLKVPTQHLKDGFQVLSSVTNSKICCGDSTVYRHEDSVDFANCTGCDIYIRVLLSVVLLKLTADVTTEVSQNDPSAPLDTR